MHGLGGKIPLEHHSLVNLCMIRHLKNFSPWRDPDADQPRWAIIVSLSTVNSN